MDQWLHTLAKGLTVAMLKGEKLRPQVLLDAAQTALLWTLYEELRVIMVRLRQ